MRFDKLHLRAFGPFTDEVLDLRGGAPGGLHVIYGPNEAGKSTSLRAVTGFLYGIPHRTGDAHLHPTTKLSVSAIVSDGNSTRELIRLKRRKDDLVDVEGQPVLESPLPRLLGNLDEKSFTSRFGLDQVELERGAEALLGGSEQGLFAAGTAGATVRRLIDKLEQSTDDLFRQRGAKPKLNRALVEYERISREARRAERPPEKWLEQKHAHEEARERVGELRQQRTEVRAELRRLNRLRAVLSDLTAWQEARARRSALGDEPPLPEDATETRQECERRLAASQVEARHLQAEIAGYEFELSALPPESPLVEVDDEQLQLSNRAGTAISARKDLPKRQASLLEQVRQVREILSDLGVAPREGEELSQARKLLPSAHATATLRALSTEFGALATAAEGAERTYAAQEREVGRLEEPEGEQPLSTEALSALEAALADAQAMQAQFSSLLEDEDSLRRVKNEAATLRAELGTEVSYADLAALVPAAAPTAAAVSRYRTLLVEREKIEDQLASRRRAKDEIKARIALEKNADVPTEERLLAARLKRDLCLSELETAPIDAGFVELRGAIRTSDEISDRLRREADRVFALASLNQQLELAEADVVELDGELERVSLAVAVSEEAHGRLCEKLGLSNSPVPALAESAFERLRLLVEIESRGALLSDGMRRKRENVRAQEEKLRALLPTAATEDQLPALIVRAGRVHRLGLQALEGRRQRAELLARAHAGLEEAAGVRARAIRALSEWRDKWKRHLTSLGLAEESTVSVVQEALSAFERLGRVLQEADNLERRIAGMERDTQALADDVRGVLKRHLPELLAADPVDAALQLQERIRGARRASDERVRYRRMITERKSALSKVESSIASAEDQLARLVRLAGVENPTHLPAAEERRREIRSLSNRIEVLEKSLLEKGEGSSLDELQREAAIWQGKSHLLIERVDELEERSEELEEAYRAAERDEAGRELGLGIYKSEDVVQARQQVTIRAAEVRSLLREYLVKKAAHELLRAQMETYAERFSGPILSRASVLFERMTLGRYTKLSIGLGERTLRCVREGQELDVSQLSRGTRAQLYFALRLSSLETYFTDQPAVPLVFDDLFVDFDDDRTTAAFEVLSELAQKVQVLYFTHLARDVEAAHDAVPPRLLFAHRLTVN